MTDNCEHIEYELIDITFELPYVLPENDVVVNVCEDGPVQEQNSPIIEYDECGILRIPVNTRSPIPVISVQSVGDLQYRWQS